MAQHALDMFPLEFLDWLATESRPGMLLFWFRPVYSLMFSTDRRFRALAGLEIAKRFLAVAAMNLKFEGCLALCTLIDLLELTLDW